ncbi:MAG: uL30 family ribosomal protein [archaeon]
MTNEGRIIGAILIKSPIGAKPDAKKTLALLGLLKINTLALLPEGPMYKSMLQKAKDYVTWGTISAELAARVIEKRGELVGGKDVDARAASGAAAGMVAGKLLLDHGIKKDIHLHPPTGGFKKTLKRAITAKGEAGDRKEKMTALLERMF